MTQIVQNYELINFNRKKFTKKDLDERFPQNKLESENVFKSAGHYLIKYYKPSGKCLGEYLLSRLPVIQWLREYNLKENTLPDLISGITIGIVHIPQGLAYALLASLPAVTGLYVSFFAVMMYVLLGTSKHLSIGTFAITSLMTANTLSRFEGKLYPTLQEISLNSNDTTTRILNMNYLSNDPAQAKILISMCLTFFSGLFQIIFGILHIGFVTKYLSEIVVTGFTTGAAIHIVTSQIPGLFGFPAGQVKIPFKLVGAYIEIFKNISKLNLATVIVSAVSIFILAVVREQINDRFKTKMIMPVPIELIVVIFGTLFSHLFKFNEKYNIKIVGSVPKGIPAPQLPSFSIFPELIGDALSIAIVSFAINISMAKLFSKKYKYEIKPNQELFAYGAGNILSSFFQGFPACVALSRCAILEGTGAKTQMYSLISSVLILIVCLVLGPLFRTLPNPCLAAIIVVALKNMLLQILQLPQVYRTSKMEGLAWLITFLGVIIFDVDVGLYIGIAASLCIIIARSQRPRACVLGLLPDTDIYDSIELIDEAIEFKHVKIIRYEESLYYANVDNFKYQIMKLSGVNPNKIQEELKRAIKLEEIKREKNLKESSKVPNGMINEGFIGTISIPIVRQTNSKDEILSKLPIRHLILDCSPFNLIDSMGANAILQLHEAYSAIGITLHLACCKAVVLKMFKKLQFEKKFDYSRIYPTIHDAILTINHQNPVVCAFNGDIFKF